MTELEEGCKLANELQEVVRKICAFQNKMGTDNQ